VNKVRITCQIHIGDSVQPVPGISQQHIDLDLYLVDIDKPFNLS